jgi:hypothetical protein
VKAYRLMDNRSHEEAEWDKELLGPLLELEALDIDLALTGFDPDELSKYTVEKCEGLVDEDQTPEPLSFAISEPGDLWILGKHRLLCGDSTSIDALERLMDGQGADLVVTDPPYNVAYEGKTKDALTIQNDRLEDGAFFDFLFQVHTNLSESQRRRKHLRVPRGHERAELPPCPGREWLQAGAVLYLGEAVHGHGPPGLSLATRTCAVRLEANGITSWVCRSQANHGVELRSADAKRRAPDHETGCTDRVPDTQQQPPRRYRGRPVRGVGSKEDSSRICLL